MLKDTLTSQAESLAPHFKPAFLQREQTTFQFVFDDDAPFHLEVIGDAFRFKEGVVDAPTLTLYIDNHDTCWDLLTGRLDGMEAFMSGRYRADGNIVLSQLLLYIFRSEDPTLPYQVAD